MNQKLKIATALTILMLAAGMMANPASAHERKGHHHQKHGYDHDRRHGGHRYTPFSYYGHHAPRYYRDKRHYQPRHHYRKRHAYHGHHHKYRPVRRIYRNDAWYYYCPERRGYFRYWDYYDD